jgi:hypothetical protein
METDNNTPVPEAEEPVSFTEEQVRLLRTLIYEATRPAPPPPPPKRALGFSRLEAIYDNNGRELDDHLLLPEHEVTSYDMTKLRSNKRPRRHDRLTGCVASSYYEEQRAQQWIDGLQDPIPGPAVEPVVQQAYKEEKVPWQSLVRSGLALIKMGAGDAFTEAKQYIEERRTKA